MIRIAVDAMGGGHAPAAIVDGAVAAARHLDIQIALAPLLGVAGLAIVGHGRSSPKAVRNADATASRFAAGDFIQRVEREIAAATVSHH
jgi:fatty acid/phospholipid biosynthesis enzyme